jgi:hypothetical protein
MLSRQAVGKRGQPTVPPGTRDLRSGSAGLLEEVDRWVLSVIDGSLEAELDDEFLRIRTSFGSQSNTVQHSVIRPATFSAAPWPASWKARPLAPTPRARRRWFWGLSPGL